ncbi:MAG: phosphoglycerate kinase [bacterium]|nr:phosphoglycerate kinase [bacterium]
MRSITEASDLEGKRVLVRVDWNVPIQDGLVLDDFRIKKSLPTLEFLIKAGAKVIVATHLDQEAANVLPLKNYVPEGAELLENLRLDPRERANDPAFAQELAFQADIFVNEAFASSHRSHTSIVGVPKLLPSYAGLNFVDEVDNLSRAFNPSRPFLVILGGAKFETKLPLVEKFSQIADKIFIAGAMAAKVSKVLLENSKIILPVGDIAALDADDKVIAQLEPMINEAKFILWNGPLGKYEEGYREGTIKLAKLLAESGAEVIVGGANTLAAIKELNLFDKFTFVSTGGGAMLEFLATGTLPGIEALNASRT